MIRPPAQSPKMPQPVDAQDLNGLTARMMTLADEINALAVNVAAARGIKEYDSDRRKRALALEVREHLTAGDSAAAAETKGRASVRYGEELNKLQSDYESAEHVLQVYEAKRIAFDACRTAISSLKTIAGNLG